MAGLYLPAGVVERPEVVPGLGVVLAQVEGLLVRRAGRLVVSLPLVADAEAVAQRRVLRARGDRLAVRRDRRRPTTGARRAARLVCRVSSVVAPGACAGRSAAAAVEAARAAIANSARVLVLIASSSCASRPLLPGEGRRDTASASAASALKRGSATTAREVRVGGDAGEVAEARLLRATQEVDRRRPSARSRRGAWRGSSSGWPRRCRRRGCPAPGSRARWGRGGRPPGRPRRLPAPGRGRDRRCRGSSRASRGRASSRSPSCRRAPPA